MFSYLTTLTLYSPVGMIGDIISPKRISSTLAEYGITYLKHPLDQLSLDGVLFRYKHFNYKSHDVFTSRNLFSTDLHSHLGVETIVVLVGSGIFEFPIDDLMIELRVHPGDYISIPKNVVHKFSSYGMLKTVRYFDGESYEAVPYYNE